MYEITWNSHGGVIEISCGELLLWAPYEVRVTSPICVTPWANREQAAVESWPARTLSSQMWDLCDLLVRTLHLSANSQVRPHLFMSWWVWCLDELGVQLQNDVKYSSEIAMSIPWSHHIFVRSNSSLGCLKSSCAYLSVWMTGWRLNGGKGGCTVRLNGLRLICTATIWFILCAKPGQI